MNLTMVTDLCSIGTLFAFVVVCAGVLVLQNKTDIPRGKFKTPYVNGKYVMPLLLAAGVILSFTYNKQSTMSFLTNEKQVVGATDILTSVPASKVTEMKRSLAGMDPEGFAEVDKDVEAYLSDLEEADYIKTLNDLNVSDKVMYEEGWDLFKHKIPTYIFLLITLMLTYFSITHNLSLIPMLGLVSCLYMMSELSLSNWVGFGVWLLVGLLIYFGYSRKNSRLNTAIA